MSTQHAQSANCFSRSRRANRRASLYAFLAVGALALSALMVGIPLSWAGGPQPVAAAAPAADTAKNNTVLGIGFDARQVSDLDKSIQFYEALGFAVEGKPTDWKVDKDFNKLGGTDGAKSRSARMTIQSSVSTTPFILILTEYKGIDRKNWGTLATSDLLSGHIDLTIQDDIAPVAAKLQAINMFRPVSMGIGGGGPMHTFGFVQDPDGMFVEMIAKRAPTPGTPPPPQPAGEQVDRTGKYPGFNHIGLNVQDPKKALAFYQDILGGDYPPLPPDQPTPPGSRPRMNMLNGWFSQANTDGKMRLELLPFPQTGGKTIPDERFSDIGVNYVGFEVTDIDAVYAQTQAAGAKTVSDGGVVKVKGGRAVIVRDPDVGGFVELFEPTK